MALEDVHVASSLIPDLSEADIATGSFYAILDAQYRVVPRSGTQIIEATVVDEKQAELLSIPVYSPTLYVERTTSDAKASPIEFV